MNKTQSSLEMIDHQRDLRFKKDLVELFEQAAGKSRSELFEMKFPEQAAAIIKHFTKLVDVRVLIGSPDDSANDFSEFHALLNIDNLAKIKNFKISFDRKTGYYGGDVKELKVRICIPINYITDKRLTAGENGAILSHELGHLAFKVEFLARQIRTNLALDMIGKELTQGQDPEKRTYLYRRALEASELSNLDIKELAQVDDPELVVVAFSNATINDLRSELGSAAYDRTMEEYYADTYATRLGFGAELVTALERVERMQVSDEDIRNSVRTAASISGLITLGSYGLAATSILFASAVSALWATAIAVASIPTSAEFNYDDMYTRVKRIRQQISAGLQTRTLTKPELDYARSQLAKIDIVLNGLHKDGGTFGDFFTQLLSRSARNRVKFQEIQSDYEKFAYNDLFEKSAMLRLSLQS